MIFINSQWQGSGLKDELKYGADTLSQYFNTLEKITIPLSTNALTTVDNIKCLYPILEQTQYFKNVIADGKLSKVSTVGGDCAIEIVPVSYLNALYKGDLCVVWIDAHADLNTPESSPSKAFHGMPLRTLLGEGDKQFIELLFSTIRPDQVCYVGLRDLDQPEQAYVSRHNMTSIKDCRYEDACDKVKDFKNVYIHLDLDVLDKSEFEFSLFPTNVGSSIADVAKLIHELKVRHHVVGFCITECTATKLEHLDKIKAILDQIEV